MVSNPSVEVTTTATTLEWAIITRQSVRLLRGGVGGIGRSMSALLDKALPQQQLAMMTTMMKITKMRVKVHTLFGLSGRRLS